MIRIRKSPGIKIIAIALVGMFLIQTDVLFSQTETTSPLVKETMDKQFEKAKSEYLSASGKKSRQEKQEIYEKAGKRLKRLKAVFENLHIPAPPSNEFKEIKYLQGQTLLWLGACSEKLDNKEEAGRNYLLAKEILGKDFLIEGLKFKGMKVYRKIKRQKFESTGNVITAGNMIPVQGKKPGWIKRKKLWLIAGGVVVAGIVAYLLLKKKPKRTLTVSLGEGVTGNPPAGTYSYKKGAVVNYSYSLQTGYTALSVKLDGSDVPASGTVRMDNHHTLAVSAAREYTLTVTVGPGINGTPVTGTYRYRAGETVNYSYSLQAGYKDLKVMLDGTAAPSGGSITMNSDHTLSASADKIDALPEVLITTPKNGDTVSGEIPVKAEASDDNGIVRFEFYIDGTRIGKYTTGPYRFMWDTTQYSNGIHKITAIAYDTAGNTGSHEITVTVSN